ncbi:hypothetical protein M569_14472 [Genlisea aurea]|uniref:Uncharacterized protein n=1 Tax=Genlisea aurea TaxID=192259 RepID=S8C0N3_9LAMI|nr:hypothetical protein M569_14472 [Genlisea aurea]
MAARLPISIIILFAVVLTSPATTSARESSIERVPTCPACLCCEPPPPLSCCQKCCASSSPIHDRSITVSIVDLKV